MREGPDIADGIEIREGATIIGRRIAPGQAGNREPYPYSPYKYVGKYIELRPAWKGLQKLTPYGLLRPGTMDGGK